MNPSNVGPVGGAAVAYLFASMREPNGLDVGRLLQLRGKVAGWLDGETLHGRL